MGQKVDPNGMRIGVIREWETKWYADKKTFADNLIEDNKIRKYIKKTYYDAGIPKITIERTAGTVTVDIYTSETAIVIGKAGARVAEISAAVQKLVGAGKKVKAIVKFRGREMAHPERGTELLGRFSAAAGELGAVEKVPTLDGRNMIMVLAPKKSANTSKGKDKNGQDQNS